jgi:hypothetical protein
MDVTGTVKVVREEKQITNTFKKKEIVVTTEEQYPQHLLIEFIQDRTELLKDINEGERVTVSIDLRGREWQSPQGEVKYFMSLHGWRIKKEGEAAGAAPSQGGAPAAGGAATTPTAGPNLENAPENPPLPEDDDDLPF